MTNQIKWYMFDAHDSSSNGRPMYNINIYSVDDLADLVDFYLGMCAHEKDVFEESISALWFRDDYKAQWLNALNSTMKGEYILRTAAVMRNIENNSIYRGNGFVYMRYFVNGTHIIDRTDDDMLWIHREKSREYNRLYNPITNDADWHVRYHSQELYAHMSVNKSNLIAYTPDNEWGMDDRQMSTRIGKFINMLIKTTSMEMTPNSIRDQVTLISSGNEPVTLEIARTQEEIAWVYNNGPSSCMVPESGEAGDLMTDETPAIVYATPDLGVAYFKNPLGRVKARCVVNMIDMQYIKIYGDEVRLTDALESNGFSAGTVEGCRVLKIEYDGHYLMSYADDVSRCDDLDDDYFIMREDGEHDCQNCSGLLSYSSNMETCNECGDRFNEDDIQWVSSIDEHVCDNCLENHYESVSGRYTSFYQHSDSCDAEHDIFYVDDEYQTKDRLEYNGYCYVESSDDWHQQDDVVEDHFTNEWILPADAIEFYERDEDGDLDTSESLFTMDRDNLDDTIEVPQFQEA